MHSNTPRSTQIREIYTVSSEKSKAHKSHALASPNISQKFEFAKQAPQKSETPNKNEAWSKKPVSGVPSKIKAISKRKKKSAKAKKTEADSLNVNIQIINTGREVQINNNIIIQQ